MASANLILSNTKYLTLTIAILIFPHIFNVGFAYANNTTSKGTRAIDGKSKGTQILIRYFPYYVNTIMSEYLNINVY